MALRRITEWEFACEWYQPDAVYRSMASNASKVPVTVSEEFAAWMAEQYRLAMRKGIEIGRNWDDPEGPRKEI
jgi:hypothetical protein